MEKELIVGFAFGSGREISSNVNIGIICEKKAEDLENKGVKPIIFTQYDVSIHSENFKIIRPNEIMNCPPSTYNLAKKAVEWAKKNGIKKIWIVAAEPHLLRATRDITYIAEQDNYEVAFRICNKEIHCFNDWFSRKSKQPWTQSPWKWWLRETGLLLTPIFFYKKMKK